MKSVKVANGFVEGQVKNVLGKELVEFLAIPYCKPPINERRLKKPEPCEGFSNDVINKLNFETCPPQIIMPFLDEAKELAVWVPKEKPDEDCLYVNIWCPLTIMESNEKRPVSVWFYGGGFIGGSSSLDAYRGDVLACQENVIFVSFNYRLGALGFLCLDEFGINGNLGIWDQVLALRWIHNNISVFNGDPENITIFGCSAGGFSVSLHLLIEESWPYFHKVIIESGVCFSDWGFLSKEESVRRSVTIINNILDRSKFPLNWNENISTIEKQKIIDYLQSVDFNEYLINSTDVKGFCQTAMLPRLDGELIKDYPRNLVKQGRFKSCPTVVLTSENEGSTLLTFFSPDIKVDCNKMIDMKYFDNCFEYYPQYPVPCKESTKTKIKNQYNIKGDKLSIHILDSILSDQFFICDSIEFVRAISKLNQLVYYMCFRSFVPMSFIEKSRGAYHGSEVAFLLGTVLKDSTIDSSYDEISKVTMAHFGKFINSGILDENLLQFDESSRLYIDIFETDWKQKPFSDDQINKIEFWMNLRKEHL